MRGAGQHKADVLSVVFFCDGEGPAGLATVFRVVVGLGPSCLATSGAAGRRARGAATPAQPSVVLPP